MLGYVAILHIYFYKKLIFSLKGRRGLQRQNCSRHFGFSNIFEISLKDPKSTGNWSFRKSNQTVWLCAVWHCAESDSAQFHTILDFRTFQFPDSAQCDTARSHVFREYLRRNEFFSETILDCLSGTQMGSIHEEKKIAKNLVTLPL